MFRKIDMPGYHLRFDQSTGQMLRWGVTLEDDPTWCPVGPEIADIEISTICNRGCAWCYKGNTGVGENMSLATICALLSRMPASLTQIAFGIGDIDANPDLAAIFELCRSRGVVPNVTVNGVGIDGQRAAMLAGLCGAVAVSHYGDDALCFDAVKALTDAGLAQVNIHKLLAEETYQSCFRLIDAAASDPRLAKLKAIVLLQLKPKGARNRLHRLATVEQYKALLDYAMGRGVAVGMDSCSAPMALRSVPASAIPSIEPCESGLFSIYINVRGEVFPCSFSEGSPGWEKGIDALAAKDFGEVWRSERLETWRRGLLTSSGGCSGCAVKGHCRSCPIYPVTPCKEAQ